MTQSIGKGAGSGQVVLVRVMMLVAISAIAGFLTTCLADDAKPDPAGIATGDKTTAVDAGGNSFVVTEPTDKKDPDYAAKKKHSMSTRPRQRTSRWP